MALAENGFEIVCADNFSNSKPLALERTRKVSGQDFEFVKADFCDPKQSDAVFEGRNIDAVIYFAAFKAVGESVEKPLKYYANNLIGLMNILASMNKYGVRNFVFSSSATVYGDHNPMPAKEEYPISEELSARRSACVRELKDVFEGKSNKFILVIGPCSADAEDSVLDYISRLRGVQEKVSEKIIIIPVEDIAYCYSEEKSTYAVNFAGTRRLLDYSLDMVQDMLDPKLFFRVSRSCIVSINAIENISKHLGTRLKLQLNPRTEEDIVVSRSRTSDFLLWLDNN